MEPLLSMIFLWPTNWAPRGFANCQGQTMAITTNTALFSLIGTTFGGNGVSTFNLPDFRGRLPVGYNPGGAPIVPVNVVGEFAGTSNVTLTISNLPSHTHTAALTGLTGALSASTAQATQSVPGTSGANTLGAPWDGNNSDAINGYVSGAANVPLTGLSITGGSVAVGLTGSSIPVNVQNPYLVVNYIIATVGIYPSRN